MTRLMKWQSNFALEVTAMKMFSWFLVVSLIFVMSAGVMAQDDEEEFEKDFMEFAIYGGGAIPMGGLSDWTISNDITGSEELGAKSGWDIGFDVGHFLTRSLVVGLNVTYAQFGIDSDEPAVATMNHQMIGPAAYLKYYFQGESNLMPYVKGQVGVDVVKFTTRVMDPNIDNGAFEYRELSYHPGLSFSFGGGLFYYTHDYGGLYLEAAYRTALTSDVISNYEGEEYTFGETAAVLDIHAGIKVFFGSDE
ncbi:MAG: outer membrane beta-barrel protein [candidate division Zixibacteria bacterium]|nr:outer membrane beta-barrel protein [candidate division Zixibacteria bacterium]